MSRTGRNDPCPCGSRKKYKRCCLVRNAAAHADPVANMLDRLVFDWPSQVLKQATRALTANDPEAMGAWAETMGEVFSEGGPLGHLRFDPDRILDLMATAAPPDGDPLAWLVEHHINDLATRELFMGVMQGAADCARRADLPEQQRIAAAIAALRLASMAGDERLNYRTMPSLEILFRVQVHETISTDSALNALAIDAMKRAQEKGIPLAEAVNQVSAEREGTTGASAPLQAMGKRESNRAVDRIRDLTNGDDAVPPVFTVAELLCIQVRTILATTGGTTEQQQTAAIDALEKLADTDSFITPIRHRLLETITQGDDATRSDLAAIGITLTYQPLRVLVLAIQRGADMQPTDSQNSDWWTRFSSKDGLQPDALEEFQSHLLDTGDAHGQALVSDLVDALQEHIVVNPLTNP